MLKMASYTTKYFRKETLLKISRHGKPSYLCKRYIQNTKFIVHAKYSLWVKKQNCLKHAKNVSTNTLKWFDAKTATKKS